MNNGLLKKEDLQFIKWQDSQLFEMLNDFYALVDDYYNMETETVLDVNTRGVVFSVLEKMFDDISTRIFENLSKYNSFQMEKAEISSMYTKEDKENVEIAKKLENLEQQNQDIIHASFILGNILASLHLDMHLIEADEQVYNELEKDMYKDEGQEVPLTIASAILENIVRYNLEVSRLGKNIIDIAREDANNSEPNV